jgi:hypothetical protein
VQPLIEFLEFTRLALVQFIQFARQANNILGPPAEFDLGRFHVEQQRAPQWRQHKLVIVFVVLLDVVDRARRLRVDRPCDVGPLGRPFGKLRPSCRRRDAQRRTLARMLNRALAPLGDFASGF